MLRRAHSLRHLPLPIALAVLTAGEGRVWGQYYYALEDTTPPLTIPQLKYINTDVELQHDTYSQKNGGNNNTYYNWIYVAPTVGISWDYFIYHPDLFTFNTLFEPGLTWQQNNNNGDVSHETDKLLDGQFEGILLREKPYMTRFSYEKAHNTYDYSFFNSATQDTDRYGVATGYRTGPVPFTVDYSHTDQTSDGLNYDTTSHSDTVSFDAQSARQNDNLTTFNYQFEDFNSSSTSPATATSPSQNFASSSTLQNITATDVENFKRSSLNSALYYDHVDNDSATSDSLNTTLGYSLELSEHLRNFEDYQFSYYSSQGSDTRGQTGRAGLQHQLYESLVSSIDVHGASADTSSSSSSVNTYSFGTTGTLGYNKRLSDWGHLSISDTTGYNWTWQDTSGSEQLINNESHIVPPTGIIFLDQPNDISWVSLTGLNGVPVYIEGQDYTLDQTANPWQIRIINTGPNTILPGQTVYANYYIQPAPSGNYGTFNDYVEVRLDFWQNRAGLFFRYSTSQNQTTTSGLVLNNFNQIQAGGDFNWHNLRLAASYTERTSTYNSYSSVTTTEGYTLLSSVHNTASINFDQQWSTYPGNGTNSNQQAEFYSWTARDDWRPLASFSWSFEGGLEQQYGAGLDNKFIAARSYIDWRIGKLDVKLGYEFQDQDYSAETRQRNFAYLRVRRNF
jgi:hypothetical protein